MRRKLAIAVAAGVAAVSMGLGTGIADADQHNQRSCEAAGGEWSSVRGEKTCTFTETEIGKNTNFECTTTEDTKGRGNIGNKTEGPVTEETEQNTGSGKCPPGQYK